MRLRPLERLLEYPTADEDMEAQVLSSLYFLARQPAYQQEKVYEFDFEPPNGFPRTNMVTEKHHDIAIRNIRGHERDFTFHKNGFELVPFPSGLTYEDFDDEATIHRDYVPKVATFLKDFLNAQRVQIDSCVVSIPQRLPR